MTLSHWCIFAAEKKRLFCAFIDYKKAFDSVQRGLLWRKLLNSGVNGKVLRVIRHMYAKTKSCVKTRHGRSHFVLFFFVCFFVLFCLKRRSASGGKFVASFVFAVFE